MTDETKTVRKPIIFNSADTMNMPIAQSPAFYNDLIKNAMGSANKSRKVPRLSVTENPRQNDSYAGVYKIRRRLLPPYVIKQIRVGNLLIAGIMRARGNVMSMFGKIQADRFDVGIRTVLREEFKKIVEPEQMIKIQERIDRANKILLNCGLTEGLGEKEKMTLSEFFYSQTINGLSFGQFSTEIIYSDTENKVFNRFRPVDAGTIYHAVKSSDAHTSIRRGSIALLQNLTGVKINPEMIEKDQYDWVQVIEGIPTQAFSPDEMVVHNLYPSTDIEHNGYPVTPLDTIITAVTTHSSIEVYNKLYFQNGKAAKGMLVIKSDDINKEDIEDIKQNFQASINNVDNSFRTPIFGVGKEENVEWIQTTPNKKDGEFEYLFDQTTRNILSAFGMSPDELPGFAHLSKGTNNQSMSESNNEWKLTAARDISLKPLINHWQTFLNYKILPLIDPELAEICEITLSGLDAESREKESQRITSDMSIHMSYADVLSEVQKDPISPGLSPKIPLNPGYRQTLDAYNNVSDIIHTFNESPAAGVDPTLRYRRDQFWSTNMQALTQYNPAAVAAYYATRPDAMEILDMLIKDMMDDTEN